MARKKKKASAYNRFVGQQMRAGKTMRQAASAWKGGRRKTTRKRTIKRRTRPRRSGFPMARRRRRRITRRSIVSGGGRIMTGMFKPKGLLAAALLGLAASVVASRLAPQVVPHQDLVAGFVVGGLPGVGGAYALRMLSGGAGIGNGGITYF